MVTKMVTSGLWPIYELTFIFKLLNKKVEFMPGVIGTLVNRIKSGLTAKVFKLFVASIIAVCMLFGIMPACESHAAFAQNTSGGGLR